MLGVSMVTAQMNVYNLIRPSPTAAPQARGGKTILNGSFHFYVSKMQVRKKIKS
jgi:hypothetical protein